MLRSHWEQNPLKPCVQVVNKGGGSKQTVTNLATHLQECISLKYFFLQNQNYWEILFAQCTKQYQATGEKKARGSKHIVTNQASSLTSTTYYFESETFESRNADYDEKYRKQSFETIK